jgi:hypothetical protein
MSVSLSEWARQEFERQDTAVWTFRDAHVEETPAKTALERISGEDLF